MNDMLLFQPFTIRGFELKNRLVMFPMGTGFATIDGHMTERQIDYYARRAAGGVGLMTIENSFMEPAGKSRRYMLGFADDSYLPGFKKVVDIAHSYGARVMLQTGHAGREASPKMTGYLAVAPSATSGPMRRLSDGSTEEKPRELTIDEIQGLVKKFGDYALRAKAAGADGVELVCGHRTLVEQFLFTDSNQRQDRYGGGIENRARFMCEVVQTFREKAGDRFIISCRVPATEYPEGSYTNNDIKKVFKMLEEAGADLFSITVASSRKWVNILPMAFPRGALVPFARWVKTFTRVPVLCGVRINDPLLAEKVLRDGDADLIGMGRPLICDPDLPQKASEGRFGDIRTCIACNKCAELDYADERISCALNVEVGREKELAIKPALAPKKFLVVGGGPAGMEFARVAALRGHKITLYEKSGELGGQLKLASVPPHKEEIANIVAYLKRQIAKLGVTLELGKGVDAGLVRSISPDAVIIATGATLLIPDIPGVDGENVSTARDILLGKNVGQQAVIIGGGQMGVETAEFLADRGKTVTVVEMLDRIAPDLEPISRMFARHRLQTKGVTLLTGSKVTAIRPDGVMAEEKGSKETLIPADIVILAVGAKPDNALVNDLKDQFPVYAIGDCVRPRGIMEAVQEASLLAHRLD